MSKYIDADWLKDNLYRRCSNEVKRNGYPEEYGLIDFIEMLNFTPAADVVAKEKYDRLLENALIVSSALQKYQKADLVEVVRCNDCKHRGAEKVSAKGEDGRCN